MVSTLALAATENICPYYCLANLRRRIGFYKYYQVYQDDEADESEPGSDGDKPGELKRTGLHSPWGPLYEFIKATGWPMHAALWKISRANMLMMIADQAGYRYKTTDEEKKPVKASGKSLAARLKARKAKTE